MLSRAKFQLKASIHLTYYAIIVWIGLSLCSIGILREFWPILAYFSLAGSVIGGWVWRYAWLNANTCVVAMRWTPDEFCCYLKNGQQVQGQLMAKSGFNPYFITLHIAVAGGGQFWWPLMIDSGPVNELRKLRVFGRWYQQIPIANRS